MVGAATNHTVATRKGMVQTLAKMKRLLRSRYLPPDFEQILFKQY